MPRFVILRHDAPRRLHFDFLLEVSGGLKTWALPQSPQDGVEMVCEALPDHRQGYLDYEGPVSGGRGTVTRWDWGTYGNAEGDRSMFSGDIFSDGDVSLPKNGPVPSQSGSAEGDRSMFSGDVFSDGDISLPKNGPVPSHPDISLPKNGPVPGHPDVARLDVVVAGQRLRGRVILQRLAGDPPRWRFLFTAAT